MAKENVGWVGPKAVTQHGSASPGGDADRVSAAARNPTSAPASLGMGGGKAGNGHPPGGNGKPGLPRDAAGSIFTAQAPAGAGRTVSAVLGEIVWLLTQSPQHKQAFFIGDLEWMAMPPILLQQFRMFYAKDKPIGVILWAFVNDEVESRLLSGNARMRPQDWKCGDKLWIVEVVAPFGGTDEMLKDLKAKVFKDREVKFRAVEGGKGVARVM
jgi:cytolysin-activating lysine-acyltransferase